ASTDSLSFFFEPFQLHLQSADLFVQLGDRTFVLTPRTLRSSPLAEHSRSAIQQLPFPLMNLRRVNSVHRCQLAHRFQLLHRRQRHLRLERRRVDFPCPSHPLFPSFLNLGFLS